MKGYELIDGFARLQKYSDRTDTYFFDKFIKDFFLMPLKPQLNSFGKYHVNI